MRPGSMIPSVGPSLLFMSVATCVAGSKENSENKHDPPRLYDIKTR
jgi:hypothetical protein